MGKEYNHKKIEGKWQKRWEEKGVYHAKDISKKPKYFSLIEFPYPSGAGMHVGHIRSNTAMDIISRKRRMEGYNVLYPIGWDAFGLPTENYAIKTGIHPIKVTKDNTDTFRKQLKSLGFSFDWSREINTTDPKYYKWTQWIFLQLLKKGLAYKAKSFINWCISCKIGLANEEVVDGKCERCGGDTEKREKEQWMLAITKYADRLHKDLDEVDFLEKIKIQQRNWIGRSEGAEIEFKIFCGSNSSAGVVKVFTTRPDTIFGATYLVLAPDHELVQKLSSEILNSREVVNYVLETKNKSEVERTAENKSKTGVELRGIKAINPASGEEIPVWIADYVLLGYGTGAIMAVPAHDERDFEFAKKYDLPVRQVIRPVFGLENKRENAVHRNTITGIVKSHDGKKILMLKWKDYKWLSGIIGGIEEGESPERAAEREVLEETGYKTRAIFVSPIKIESHFFAEHKNEWRSRIDTPVVLELIDDKLEIISSREQEKHEAKWIDIKETFSTTMFGNNKLAIELALSRSAYVGFDSNQKDFLVNSGQFDGLDSQKAKKEIIKFIGAKEKVTFKLRDWVFSRQRYWGEPIPVVYCDKCGVVPVPEKDLPVELPKVKNYQPTDSGESPLANIKSFVNIKCPSCKSPAKRETDTMPNWAGSSWYFLRYIDPKNKKEFASQKKLKYWLGNNSRHGGVDWYNGGMEHTTLHLLYSRFWHKFLYDLKLVPTKEPYMKRTSHGMILGEGGVKMSKSLGNVINPDDIVKVYGADTLRLYEMFMGPFDQSVAWSTDSIVGARRFIEKVWRIGENILSSSKPVLSGVQVSIPFLDNTIKKVSEDIEAMHFNTAISTMMICANHIESALARGLNVSLQDFELFLKILSPFAPHVTEEIWNSLGHKTFLVDEPWPKADPEKMKEKEIKIVIQVNGKVRDEMMIEPGQPEEEVKKMSLKSSIVQKHIDGKEVKKVIYVKNRLVNIVI